MTWPWVSRRAYDSVLAECSRLHEKHAGLQRQYDTMVERFTAQLVGMTREGFRPAPPVVMPEPPWQPATEVQDAILEVAGPDPSALKATLNRYAFHNRHRPSQDVATDIRHGG